MRSATGSDRNRITYVYDSLNRLIRATYDKTTFTYTYDKTGNRLTKKTVLTKPMGTVDFGGDAKTDVTIFRASTGTWHTIRSSDGSTIQTQWGTSGDIPVPGDFDGDGKTDIAVYRQSTGTWLILPSSNPGVPYTVSLSTDPDDVPVTVPPIIY